MPIRQHATCLPVIDVTLYHAMSTIQQIEAAVQRLSPAELAELRAWLEGYCEEQLELTATEAGKLNAWADKERAAGRTKVFESSAAYVAQAGMPPTSCSTACASASSASGPVGGCSGREWN